MHHHRSIRGKTLAETYKISFKYCIFIAILQFLRIGNIFQDKKILKIDKQEQTLFAACLLLLIIYGATIFLWSADLGRGTTGGARRRQALIGCCWWMGVATAGGSSDWTILSDVTTWNKTAIITATETFHKISKIKNLMYQTLVPFDLLWGSGGRVKLTTWSGGGALSCFSVTGTFCFIRYKTWGKNNLIKD